MKKIRFQENGQALIVIALAAVVLFGFAALAIDGSILFSDKRHAQNAADTAAIAAALARTRGQDLNAAGQARALSNGYDTTLATNEVVITTTATATGVCPGTGADIQVKITSIVKTTFARVLGWQQFTNNVYATARSCDVKTTGTGGPKYASAIYSTKTVACGNGTNDKSIYTGGSSRIQVWGGGFGSASTDPDCMHFKGGEVQLKLSVSLPKTCADLNSAAPVGTFPSGADLSAISPQDGCNHYNAGVVFPAPEPDLGITCSTAATKTGSTLSPGNFTGTFPGAGVTTLQPGTYCVNGEFNVSGGTLTGNGVTIVLNTGGIIWNGNAKLVLYPPTSGPYKGLTIYAPPSNTSQMRLNGTNSTILVGTLLAPSAPCDLNGTVKLEKVKLQMVCYTWQMNGNADLQIEYDPENLFSQPLIQDPTITLLN